jgi:hypothetical protein
MKRNSDTIYFRRVGLEMNSFSIRKVHANMGFFHGAVLCKEINYLGEYLEVTIRKTWTQKRYSDVYNKDKCCDWKSFECADVCDGTYYFTLMQPRTFLCISNAVV